MTQVAMIFEREKEEALAQATIEHERRRREEMTQVAMIFEREKEEALEQATIEHEKERQEEMTQIVLKMLKKNYSTEEVVSLVPNYSKEDVEALRKETFAGSENT